MNLTELLEVSIRQRLHKTAFVEENAEISYAQLGQKIGQFAEVIKSLNLPPGVRVGLCWPNSTAYVALTYALWQLGMVVVPVPTECPAEELVEIVRTMELSAVLSQKALGSSQSLATDLFISHLSPTLIPDNHGLNIAFIRFTSGTTNARKGVVLAHETIRDRVVTANAALNISEHDTIIWCLPMAHHFLITIVLYLNAGATVVLARHVTARPFLEAIQRWRGTVLYAAPFHYALLAREASSLAMDSVRLAVATTCALPEDVAVAFFQRYGKSLVPALGIIEVGLVALNSEAPRERWNSVGKPVAGLSVKILRPDEQGVGEVAVSGPGICDAYAAPWQSREAVQPDGWFITGDLGRIDTEGFLYVLARKTAVINLAGRKVFPEEIETILNRHPAIRESRVFGRQHPHLGEVVEAEIVLQPEHTDADNLVPFCREHLAAYKIPTRFHIVPALPRTPVTGKIRRVAAMA